MRNLKRVLSLSLASIMLLGMMVIGSSAASDYTDVDYNNDNVEAIEVLQAINVMSGDLDNDGNLAGTFRPGDEVKRSEMARIMAFLMDLDYDYYIGVNPFSDMVGHWAEKYAAACAANGIIYGRGDGIYDPDKTVTAVEAASMLMRALGYFQNPAVDQPNGFEIDTIRQAGRINLFNRVDAKTNEPMTRNDVAQLVLNTLQSGMVEPSNNSKIDVTVGDAQVSIGSSNYVYTVARDDAVGQAINDTKADRGNSSTGLEGEILDLGEKLYDGKLKLHKYEQDAFGRPARTWEFDGTKVGTYVKTELLRQTWTEKVTGRMLYELLTKSTIDTYAPHISVDGETAEKYLSQSSIYNYYFDEDNLIHSNTEAVGGTGNGVITEVYVDTLSKAYYISVINTYLAKASGDYNEKQEKARFNVWALDNLESASAPVLIKNRTAGQFIPLEVSNEDFDVTDVKDEDIFLVQVAEGKIQKFITPVVIDDAKITSFSEGSWVVADGTKYTYNHALKYDYEVLDEYDDFNMKNTTYRLYLDPNDFVMGVEIVEDADQYVFLAGMDNDGSNIASTNAKGKAIFTDGTVATITINMDKSKDNMGDPLTKGPLMNTWCTYSVDSNNVYTLTEVADDDTSFTADSSGVAYTDSTKTDKLGQGRTAGADPEGVTPVRINAKNIRLDGIALTNYKTVYGNDDSVYITAETKAISGTDTTPSGGSTAVIINDVDSVSVGIQNTNLLVWDAATVKASDSKYSSIDVRDIVEGAYALFNNKGYVIAAVVVGEDDGAVSHYAFVHTDKMSQEDWDATSSTGKAVSEDGIYTWYRKVIMDGEEVTLIEKTDTDPYLNKMDQGQWYEIRLKEDGTVRKTIDLKDKFTNDSNKSFINALNKIEDAVDAKDSVLLYVENLTQKSIKFTGSTLQVETSIRNESWGFPVAPNAKIVLLTDKTIDEGKLSKYTYSNTYTGPKGMETAVAQLNKNNTFVGDISAVFNNGLAIYVVLRDATATNVNTGSGSGFGGSLGDDITLPRVASRTGTAFDVEYYDPNYGTDKQMTEAKIMETVVAPVAAYTGSRLINASWNWTDDTVTATLDEGKGWENRDVTITPKRVIAVYVDDVLNGYVRAELDPTATHFGLKSEKASGNYTSTLTAGEYLQDAYVKAGTISDLTAAGTTADDMTGLYVQDTGTDVYLYTAYAVTLTSVQDTGTTTYGTLAATYTKHANEADAVTMSVNNGTPGEFLVAKNTKLSLTFTATDDFVGERCQLTVNGEGVGRDKKITDETTDILEYELTVTGDSAITVKKVVQITVNGVPTVVGATTGDDWTIRSLLSVAGITNYNDARIGKWLVKIADPITVAVATNDLDGKIATPAEGDEYEFGYYKVTLPSAATPASAFANIGGAQTSESWTVTGISAPAADGVYYLKSGGKVTYTLTTSATGFTASGDVEVSADGATAEVSKSYTVTGSTTEQPECTGGTIKFLNTVKYADGAVSFTWTIGTADLETTDQDITGAA